MEKKTILITGCAGFIGYHLTKKLKNNFLIIGVDNLNNYYDISLKNSRLKKLLKFDNFIFYKFDIKDKKKIKNVFSRYKINCIVHLAAQAGVRYSIENPQEYIDNNITGFLNILEFSKTYNIKNLIYASSSSVYGSNNEIPFIEKQKTDLPISFYGVTKKTNELMAYTYSKLYNIITIGLRFFTVYGPYGRPDMSYFSFTKSILNDEPISLYNFGKHMRSFTYIDDIITSIDLIINKVFENEISDKNLILNIGGSQSIQLKDYITCFEKELNKKAIINFVSLQPGDVIKTEADTHLLESLINFKPQISIEEGIPKFINWYKKYYEI